MYLSTVSRPEVAEVSDRRKRRVSSNVVALGAVSLITDISSEMVTAVLPLYLVVGLGMTPVLYGAIDGLYTGATALLRLVGGFVADRTRRHKTVAGVGYGVASLAKLGLIAAGNSVAGIGAAITADRAGKGLRTGPRDALITLSTPQDQLGRAFGVHRSMDALGAFIGPLAAVGVLMWAGSQEFDAVFFTSFVVAAFGVVVLVLFVRDHREKAPPKAVDIRAALGLVRHKGVGALLLAASLLGLVVVGDGFVYLLLQKRGDLSMGWFPLLAVGTSLVYLLLATPLGVLADKIGRAKVMLSGYFALALVYLALIGPIDGIALTVAVLLLYGFFYAATDGVLMALAGRVLPKELRATGMALVQTGQALAYLGSSVLFGLSWQLWGPTAACAAAGGAVVVTIVVTALIFARVNRSVQS
ncbi:MFS transporter [Actinokineospora globicatena]|uniref:MFS transporter n=1 Tax=Actinokineospora globicatena TaxID=103729 RepID=UPI0024A2B480|nr:MFS transporter [Actinokineospora globicatena]MCP2302711.1 Sugar phosphate permease [Actinokineospora globicatena]GLW75601.1 MFS transporter [Actinokineospora globicatena]GLW82441.1 MFS transporter [Actinokineospora globicatena]